MEVLRGLTMKTLNLKDYTITQNGDIINNKTKRILKPQPNGKGYLRIQIGGTRYFVHRLVAEKYVPNIYNKPQVNHIDGNKLNNNYKNLEWVTNNENRNHAVLNNLHLCGEDCSWSKLAEVDVLYIRNNKQITKTELAKKFNVSRTTIRDIQNNRSWKQLSRSRG